ncbi:ABC transporter permease [Halostella sp. JP-L12]|uniref:ABC transporter permease n=1 Tax=Halostella TaxID=1843185 RepID=UPI000EF76A7A|nr:MULTISPECIES: ABC transporter permease [Halostella]NHN48054.1 ABC transporter permease [Halostella sp. JP-L12]
MIKNLLNPTGVETQKLEQIKKSIVEFLQPLWKGILRRIAVMTLSLFVVLGVIAPYLPLPNAYETMQRSNGEYVLLEPPSGEFLLGTTEGGYNVFAQTVLATRTSLKIGLFSAMVLIVIGLNIGLIAGYYGGWVETILMGIDDLAYGMPFLPFAIVFVAVIGQSTWVLVAVIGLLLWRGIARVVRSETLSLREREFVKSARASGSSNIKIMYFHILPNLLPIIIVYFVLGAIYGILIEASLSFVGLGDPTTISWGMMLFDAFQSGAFTTAWWWVLPPSFGLWLFVWSLYTVGRALEDNLNENQLGGLTE